MKLIEKLSINTQDLSATQTIRRFQVNGDNGAVFSLQMKTSTGKYYDFISNTFSALNVYTSRNRLTGKEIKGGIYSGNLVFPADVDGEVYTIILHAEPHYKTELSVALSPKSKVIFEKTITQVANAEVSFKPYTATTANYAAATNALEIASAGSPIVTQKVVLDIDWAITGITAGSSTGYGFTQPKTTFDDVDFFSTTTQTVDGAVTASKTIVVDSISNLTPGMIVTAGTGLSGTPTIQKVEIVSKKPTITLSTVQTLGDDVSLTCKSIGSGIIGKSNKMIFSFSDLVITAIPTTVSIHSGQSGSSTGVNLNGTTGVSEGSYVEGFGVTNSPNNPIVAVTSNATDGSIVLTVAQDLDKLVSGTSLAVIGSTHTYTITGKLTIDKYPTSDTTIYLNLDNLLTVGTAS